MRTTEHREEQIESTGMALTTPTIAVVGS